MSTGIQRRGGGQAPAQQSDGRSIKAVLAAAGDRLAAVLPKHLTPERTIQVVSTMVWKTPKLQNCHPDTIIAAVIEASELGLDLSRASGEAWLVPYGSECQFQPGYKGLCKLAYQGGFVAYIEARLVHRDDVFEVCYSPDLAMRHIPDIGGDSPVVGVYAVAKLTSGDRLFEHLTVAEVEAVRRRSRAGNNGPWVTDWNEMAKKTAIRRVVKTLPKSPQLLRAIEADEAEYTEAGIVSPPPAQLDGLRSRLGIDPPPEPEFQASEGVERPLRSEADDAPEPLEGDE